MISLVYIQAAFFQQYCVDFTNDNLKCVTFSIHDRVNRIIYIMLGNIGTDVDPTMSGDETLVKSISTYICQYLVAIVQLLIIISLKHSFQLWNQLA